MIILFISLLFFLIGFSALAYSTQTAVLFLIFLTFGGLFGMLFCIIKTKISHPYKHDPIASDLRKIDMIFHGDLNIEDANFEVRDKDGNLVVDDDAIELDELERKLKLHPPTYGFWP